MRYYLNFALVTIHYNAAQVVIYAFDAISSHIYTQTHIEAS